MYNVVFITHLPSFYKVNLYERLATTLGVKFHVIYCGKSSVIRSFDFTRSTDLFSHQYLSDDHFESRNIIITSFRLISFLLCKRPCLVFVNGWDLTEFFLSLLYSLIYRKKLVVQVEGSDSYPVFRPAVVTISKHLTNFYKSLFLQLPSAILFSSQRGKRYYQSLFSRFAYKAKVINGVGISTIEMATLSVQKLNLTGNSSCRFLGVSRYSTEKNIISVLHAFASRPNYSYCHYGDGLHESDLEATFMPGIGNISLNNSIANFSLPKLFTNYHCLILASNFEAWGLVAEEANICGLPCILSSASGYGEWSKSVGINIVIDSTDSAAILEALDTFYAKRSCIISGPILRDLVVQKNNLQIKSYRDLILSANVR